MFHTYPEVLNYLYANLPMFQRVGAVALKKDLTNTIALCSLLGNPHQKFRSVHIGGTNGKGSTAHMLASVLQSAGYKTGLYTSPHLKEFTERIKVNGTEISKNFVLDFVNRLQQQIELIKPSFFEITVAMAFDYFAFHQVDIAVFEVGLGGRLDSTNVIMPEVAVITNIGLDHTDLLGDTLEKIAFEKAGIIKTGIPVVIGERQAEIEELFKTIARQKDAPIFFADTEYSVSRSNNSDAITIFKHGNLLHEIALPLKGNYQLRNLPGILGAVDVLKGRGFQISDEAINSGLEKTVIQTGLKGRWQTLAEKPLIICDTGHNVDGIKEIVKQIHLHRYRNLFIVFGMVKDKDRKEILELLPKNARYYFCQAKIPRALEAETLSEEASLAGLQGEVIPDVNEAIKRAKSLAGPEDFVFIGGSTFVVAEIENL
jgi:dihydrofolate synthase / folylpolyglutamate synthase